MEQKVAVTHRNVHIVSVGKRKFEVTFPPHSEDSIVVLGGKGGSVVVGYLVLDDDCANPIENQDGLGKIYDMRCSPQGKKEALEALGIDENGNKVGTPNPMAVLLDVHSHSGETWRISGSKVQFPDERWDVSFKAGVWVPDFPCLNHRNAVKIAAIAVSEFNKWLAGDCWGVCVDVFNSRGKKIEDDACWGYIGHEYAMKTLREEAGKHAKRNR